MEKTKMISHRFDGPINISLQNKYRNRKNNCIRFHMDPIKIFEEEEDGEGEQGEG